MMKLLIGPALTGAGYIAGSIYGRDVEQPVHKSADAAYAAVEDAVRNVPASGMTSFEGGTPMPYKLEIEEPGERQLHLTLTFAGKPGAEADVQVTGQPGGADSLVVARFHGDREGLRTALAGTDKARLAYAPDWMLNLAGRPLLRQFAAMIEHGELSPLSGASAAADARAKWEANLTPDQRQQVADWQQYEATRPSVDASQPTTSN